MTPTAAGTWPQPAIAPQQAQLYDLNRRAAALDENNQDLHAQLAQSRQQTQLLREQVTLLQKQLADTANSLRDSQVAREESERKFASLQATTTRRGAVITANSSARETLRPVAIDGVPVQEDGDRIRIVLPADQLFVPGTAQLVGSAFPLLDRVASEIARNYPRQQVVIEGHTDMTPVLGDISHHQLAAAQAVVVFDQMTRRNRLPARQFSISASGANQPRTANATQAGQAENRRIEMVVYPETVVSG